MYTNKHTQCIPGCEFKDVNESVVPFIMYTRLLRSLSSSGNQALVGTNWGPLAQENSQLQGCWAMVHRVHVRDLGLCAEILHYLRAMVKLQSV